MDPISTLVFAALRCPELTHLLDVVRKFGCMFGACFVLAAADLCEDSHVDIEVGGVAIFIVISFISIHPSCQRGSEIWIQ